MATNDTYQLSVEVLDGNGVPIENAVTWKSSDESLATVSGGMITTGNTLGTVTITASTATLEKDFIVHIKQLEISVPSGTFDIVKGENLQLVAVLVGEGNNREQVSNADITWTENGSYTDLSPAGILTLSDVGNNGDTIRVDAIYKNNTALTAFTNITVETSATVINIKGEDGYDTNTRTMAVNDTYQLSVEVLDGNGEAVPNAVTWKSSDESLATVSGGMITTGNTLGTVTITASTATLEKDFIVHIKQLEISVPSGTFDIVKGENLQLVAVLVGEGNNREQVSNADVSWTETGSYADLSSAGILTLSETGMSGDKIQVNAVYKNNPALTAIKDITVETSATVINIKGDNGSYLDTRTMAVNDTYQLSVEVLDGNGDAVPNAVTWKSSDESLATVSGGTITTNSTLGTVTITASTATLEKDFIVHIKRLEINVPSDDASGTFDIVYGENLELEAVLVGEGNSREQVSNADITWTENYSSAEISTAGILTLTDTGTIGDPITVNAVYKNNTKLTASKDIRVETAASVINILGSVDDDTFVNADTRTMAANDTYYLQAEVLDKNGTEIPASTLRWTSNNTAVATVDPVTGKITTSSSFGIVTITASIGDVQKDFTVEVLGLRILPEGNLSMFTVLGLGKHVYLTAEKFDGSIWSSATEVEWDILNESGLNIINGPTVVDGEVSADGIAYIGVVTVVASIPGTNVKAEADISVTAALSF
jgi:uncharacterized protein YjdB